MSKKNKSTFFLDVSNSDRKTCFLPIVRVIVTKKKSEEVWSVKKKVEITTFSHHIITYGNILRYVLNKTDTANYKLEETIDMPEADIPLMEDYRNFVRNNIQKFVTLK